LSPIPGLRVPFRLVASSASFMNNISRAFTCRSADCMPRESALPPLPFFPADLLQTDLLLSPDLGKAFSPPFAAHPRERGDALAIRIRTGFSSLAVPPLQPLHLAIHSFPSSVSLRTPSLPPAFCLILSSLLPLHCPGGP